MNLIESIPSYKRYLRRRNLSAHTIKNYLHRLQCFVIWVAIPVEEVNSADIKRYIDILLEKRVTAQTVNGHLTAVRRFYGYLIDEEDKRQGRGSASNYAMLFNRCNILSAV
jgi:site-specific recombinase XerD